MHENFTTAQTVGGHPLLSSHLPVQINGREDIQRLAGLLGRLEAPFRRRVTLWVTGSITAEERDELDHLVNVWRQMLFLLLVVDDVVAR